MKNSMLYNTSSVFAAVLLIVLNCCSFSSTAALSTSEDKPECVYVKSAYFDEYLYTSTYVSSDETPNPAGSRVVTWRSKKDGSAADWGKTWGDDYRYQGVWKLSKQDTCDGCYTARTAYHFAKDASLHFAQIETVPGSPDRHRIKVNVDGQYQYIYASPDFDNESSKSVFKILKDLRVTLQLGNQSQQYTISPIPDSNSSHRRNVFVWGPREEEKFDTMGELRDWVIEKAECPPPGLVGSNSQTESASRKESSPACVPPSKPICIYIKNVKYGEYLYSTTDKPINDNISRVFTWRNSSAGPASDWGKTWGSHHQYQGVWLLEKNHNCLECYTLMSAYLGLKSAQPFFAVPSLIKLPFFPTIDDPSRRPVYTYRGDSLPAKGNWNSWKLETISGFSDRVRIKHKNAEKKFDEYLYAAADDRAFDEERRSVFTWSSEEEGNVNTWGGAGDWIFGTAECPPF